MGYGIKKPATFNPNYWVIPRRNVKGEYIVYYTFSEQPGMTYYNHIKNPDPEKYKHKEYWTFNTEAEYIKILEFFFGYFKNKRFDTFRKMRSSKPGEFPIEEMSRKLYCNYNKLLEESKGKWGHLETKDII